MNCCKCKRVNSLVQAGTYGGEIVIRCECGTIILLDNEAGAPRSWPINRVRGEEVVFISTEYTRRKQVGTWIN